MKLDPEIELVARALFAAENDPILWCDHTDQTRDYYRDSARIAADMIRAQMLEEAAQVADLEAQCHEGRAKDVALSIAAALRALKEQT